MGINLLWVLKYMYQIMSLQGAKSQLYILEQLSVFDNNNLYILL